MRWWRAPSALPSGDRAACLTTTHVSLFLDPDRPPPLSSRHCIPLIALLDLAKSSTVVIAFVIFVVAFAFFLNGNVAKSPLIMEIKKVPVLVFAWGVAVSIQSPSSLSPYSPIIHYLIQTTK